MTRPENADREIDIVLVILQLAAEATEDLTPEKVRDLEQTIRGKYGGLRARIAKRRQHPTAEQREKIVKDFIAKPADVDPGDVASSNGISRASLYRYLGRRVS